MRCVRRRIRGLGLVRFAVGQYPPAATEPTAAMLRPGGPLLHPPLIERQRRRSRSRRRSTLSRDLHVSPTPFSRRLSPTLLLASPRLSLPPFLRQTLTLTTSN
ncbi:hypothetical protein B296_00046769 [Ensete ventricosum]|uniref:Uncharacterized protein n=1 Tax=Ensete ventricosum TaxID=4639 RepID=A0A426YR69_ENSVE|nr:hypothetical protein B296_00046769 [Ensete ventricosum]